ncbi:MAG: hypothetical protein V3R33_04775 [Anaerolineales bacterium]
MDNPKKYVVLLGIAIGYSISVSFLNGGYDALVYYLKSPFPETTAPAWVYLFTYPISLFGWPLSLSILTFISVIVVGAAAITWGNDNWWIALLSTPFIWNIYLGQIEFLPVIGLLLTSLFKQKKISSVWLGISWLALITKPHVGFGILFLQLLWILNKELKINDLIPPIILFSSLIFITYIFWPNWIEDWFTTLQTFRPNKSWNASIWPYGLLALPISIYFSRKESMLVKTRMLSSASLLASPYFSLYHCTTLFTITDSILVFIVSWAIVFIGNGIPDKWMRWSWLVPLTVLLIDLLKIYTHSINNKKNIKNPLL